MSIKLRMWRRDLRNSEASVEEILCDCLLAADTTQIEVCRSIGRESEYFVRRCMRELIQHLPTAVFCVGAWVFINGVLHDIFVLLSDHGKKYDRDLRRLLMDGHILITCGAVQMIACKGLQANEQWALFAAGVASVSLLVIVE